ncbi:MAG: gliding motility-associated C-terminal domain-containing protein [Bacteroidetes bacterium]|nr:gliding motility-associated C-terminal domain-containing protein [Bacteroidota bacterium]
MPNAFSPNGDGLNDLFNVTGSFSEIQYFSMQIYDRWGLMIQETNDSLEGWNGRMNNHCDLLNEGVYVYTLTIHDLGYNVFHLKGFVVLLK